MASVHAPFPAAEPRGTRRAVFWALLFAFPLAVLLTLYGGVLVARAASAYWWFKIHQHMWVGRVWRYDPELGYAHVPGYQGDQMLAPGLSYPVRIDSGGFRTVEEGVPVPTATGRPVLSLGDSFTFGQGCREAQTYTYLVGAALGRPTHNAGVSGYGLSQVLLLARKLIPSLQPEIVLVAYAPWLPERSLDAFAGTRVAAIPTPYFSGVDGEHLAVEPPVGRPIVFELGLDRFWASPVGVGDALSFFRRAALPLLFHGDVSKARVQFDWATHRLPRPMQSREDVVRLAYREIVELAERYGGRVVAVDVGSSWPPIPSQIHALEEIPGLTLIQPREALFARLPDRSFEAYEKAYSHWVGDPPRLVDIHPNPTAHAIIADAILAALRAPAP